MIKNYFKVAWRNLNKHKLLSFINIFGLASGMTMCMLALIKIKEAYVNADFYKIFGFKIIEGFPAIKPQTVVLTSETAERFFGKENAIGKVITIGQSQNFLVTGILDKPPYHSHLTFDLLASASSLPLLKGKNVFQNWSDEASAYTYVQLKKGVPEQTL